MTTHAEVVIDAPDERAAYDIADGMDGGDFIELAGLGEWRIEVIELP